MTTAASPDAGFRLLAKLREFAGALDADERALLGALIAPAVARAHEEAEVVAFGAIDWTPAILPEALVRAVLDAEVRVVGLGD